MTSPSPGYYQNELRDLRGNAMVGAVVAVFDIGTTTPATIYSDAARTSMVASPLPAAAGLNRPGIDAGANIAFYAEDTDSAGAPLEYDVRATFGGNSFTFRAKPAPAPVPSTLFASVGRRSPNTWNRYADMANGALPALAESGHAWTFNGQTPAVLGGKKRNPTPASGPTYDSLLLDGPFGSMGVEFSFEASGTLGGQAVALLSSSTLTGPILQNFLHLAVDPAAGWGLSYVIGTLSGGNPLVFIAAGTFDSAALGGSYRMELAVEGDTIYVRLPDGNVTAVVNATAAALAGRRCTWELLWTAGQAEPRIIAESAAVYDQSSVIAPPRDVFGLARWIAEHDSPLSANAGNLIAKKGDADNEVEIGRLSSVGVAGIRLDDFEVFRAGVGVARTLGRIGMTTGLGVGNQAAATTLGAVTGKTEIFDATTGASLGFVPIYGSIT